jgi:hypothetical protein
MPALRQGWSSHPMNEVGGMVLMTAAVPADPTAMGCVKGLRRLGQDRRRLKITVPAAND